jgi:DNA modification methylase
MSKKMLDIDYAIVELTRPPIYTCMKYWGKKPHNVWHAYIDNYVPEGGVFLDPFCGSGMSGLEAIRAGKKAICFDINPLTSFVFDVMCSQFDIKLFSLSANSVIENVKNDKTYQQLFCYSYPLTLHNAKYRNGICYECCFIDDTDQKRISRPPMDLDIEVIKLADEINNIFLCPDEEFRESDAFSTSLRNKAGNNSKGLYTKRNLYVLSLIFHEICKVDNAAVKQQLQYAFIQSVHLSTRMCVPRSKKTNRDYSTSWGRSGYFVANTEMEMNPLLLFKNNCFGKQSVSSCLQYLQKYIGYIRGKKIDGNQKIDLSENINLWYGVIDAKQLSSVVPKKSIDFVLTDPPYGGLIQYLDLSNIWLSWLSLCNPAYKPDYANEITINQSKTVDDFCGDMISVLQQVKTVLKDDSKVVLTFNNKRLDVWSSILKSIQYAGFKIEKVIHQQNKRSGESNVTDKYGSSSCDFYIRCVSSDLFPVKTSETEIQKVIVDTAKQIISSRNEPTPYQILLNGIIATISERHLSFEKIDIQIQSILEKKLGIDFIIETNLDSLAGNYWWITDRKYNSMSEDTLTNRVRKLTYELLEKRDSIAEELLLTQIYRAFPNGMTPDIIIVNKIMNQICYKKGEVWVKK